jgi:hypothetical protein
MATKKSSSTKAKIKTTKKTTSVAKTSTKSAQIKAPLKSVNIMKLRSLHMMSAGVFILLAVLAGFLMGNDSHQLTIGYLSKDILAADKSVLAPAIRSILDVEVRWLLVVIMALSAVLPLLYVTRWEQKYIQAVTKSRTVSWRWFDFGITAALMVEVVALLSGITDIAVLKLIAGLIALSLGLGWIAERQNNVSDRPAWAAYAAGLVAGVLPWVPITVAAIATVVYGSAWSPWYVYALYAVTIAGSVGIACIQSTNYRRRLAAWQQNYLIVERNYLAVNLLTKAAFGLVLIIGLLK